MASHAYSTTDVNRPTRARLAAAIEAAIALLDELDGDPDLEPSLGSLERHPAPYRTLGDAWTHQLAWADGGLDDREADAADEAEEPGAVPTLGWAEPDVVRVRRSRQAVRS